MDRLGRIGDRMLAVLAPKAVARATCAMREYCYRKESCPIYHTMFCRYSSGGHEVCNCQYCVPTC
ncbi:hypothetical protein [Pseudonocardia sp. TRM90224]|uniref:hypothetical protein n=1 Tax=Pseudonocardia sp. TRM90224 TaxID=2812678 RepID=UPI001E536239|nr:hypothetical protein [Pseudonocardia sp. TRM90224]